MRDLVVIAISPHFATISPQSRHNLSTTSPHLSRGHILPGHIFSHLPPRPRGHPPLTPPSAPPVAPGATVTWPSDASPPEHLRFFAFPASLIERLLSDSSARHTPDGYGFTFSFTASDGSVRWGCAGAQSRRISSPSRQPPSPLSQRSAPVPPSPALSSLPRPSPTFSHLLTRVPLYPIPCTPQ